MQFLILVIFNFNEKFKAETIAQLNKNIGGQAPFSKAAQVPSGDFGGKNTKSAQSPPAGGDFEM